MDVSIVFLNLKSQAHLQDLQYYSVKGFRRYYFYMTMANKSQTGLFPEASQDKTGNSNDSEQNPQLLKI